jgi:hypothetical protein
VFLDGRTVTLSNVPNWRSQLGYAPATDLAAAQVQIANQDSLIVILIRAVADLTTRMTAVEGLNIGARLDALEAAPAGGGGGSCGSIVDGDDGAQYELFLTPVFGGLTLSWRCISPVVLADDGNTYRLKMVYSDGTLVLDWAAAPGATPGEVRVYSDTGVAYRLALVYADDGATLTLDWVSA